MSFNILRSVGVTAAATWCPNYKSSTTTMCESSPGPTPQPQHPHDQRALVIRMDRMQMVQRKPWSLLSNPNKIAVRRLVDLLRHAKQDHTIGCLYATFGAETSNLAQAGWADLEEVRKAMADFAAEKEVLAVANTFNSASHKEYYLASIASTILVRETGEVNLLGLCISQMFQAQQLKEAGIKVHVFKSGLYKSAGNVYTESKFTPAERENKTDILWQIQNDTFESITTSRSRQLLQSTWPNMQRRKEQSAWTGMFWEHFMADESSLFPAVMSPYFLDIPDESESSESDKWHVKLVSVFQAALEPYAPVIIGAMQYIWKEIAHAFPFEVASTFDSGLEDAMPSDPQQIWTQILDEGVFPMLLAQQAGLVDHVLVADPTPTFLSTCPSVSLDEYDNEVEQQQRLAATRTLRKRKLLGSGQCLDFVHPQPTFQIDSGGAEQFESLCRQILLSSQAGQENIKCLVVSIDSPGGELNASERIYEAIKGTHLPVVVSFGNTATSGGYFVAASADRIFTSKNTMTGSIGVIAVREDHTKKAAKDGISVEHIKTGDLAGLHDKFHPLTSNMNRVFRCRVERGYETFKERVAMGRKMTSGQVEAVAKGRVWTGAQAVRNGLCDEIGGLNDAIDFAQLTYCSGAASVVPFPKEDTVWEKLSLFLSARGDAEPKGSDSSSAMLFFMHDEEAAISCLLERNLDELKP